MTLLAVLQVTILEGFVPRDGQLVLPVRENAIEVLILLACLVLWLLRLLRLLL